MTAKPRAAISWSGGKDCCTALMRIDDAFDVVAMLTMFGENGGRSRSHGLRPGVIAAQAARLSLESLSARCNWNTYTDQYLAMLEQLKARAITHVVFGDIVGDSHRAWNEMVCAHHGLTPVLPLWGESTAHLACEFLARGGEARLVTVRPPVLDDSWLGIAITEQSLAALERLGVDPCGEFGEFHTVVTQCPLFSAPLQLLAGERVMCDGCWAIDFTPAAVSED
jgi:diphthine-ammonia ligase